MLLFPLAAYERVIVMSSPLIRDYIVQLLLVILPVIDKLTLAKLALWQMMDMLTLDKLTVMIKL